MPEVTETTIRPRVQMIPTGKSRTKQSFKNEANINKIMAKYEKTGMVEHINGKTPRYGDFAITNTFQEALNTIQAAEDVFSALPAIVRKEFDNDPVKFVEFAEKPENYQKMVDYGLADPIPEPEPAPAPITEPIIETAPTA